MSLPIPNLFSKPGEETDPSLSSYAPAGGVNSATLPPPVGFGTSRPFGSLASAPAQPTPPVQAQAPAPTPVNQTSLSFSFEAAALARVIPTTLLSMTIPPQNRVSLPIPPLAIDRNRNVARVPVSLIYKSCPYLFAQSVTEEADFEVFLPLPPVETEMQPAIRPLAPPANRAASPFTIVAEGDPAKAAEAAAAYNPFTGEIDEPVPAPAPRNGNGNGNGNGSHANGNGNHGFNPFSLAEPSRAAQIAAAALNQSQQAAAQAATSAPNLGKPSRDTSLVFGLPQLLQAFDAEFLGVDPETLPLGGSTRVPLSVIKPQLATGRVTAKLSDLLLEADEASQNALRTVNPNLEIQIPLKDIFHQLPSEDSTPAVPRVAQTGWDEVETPFSPQAREDAERAQVPPRPAPFNRDRVVPVGVEPLPSSPSPQPTPVKVAEPAPSLPARPAPVSYQPPLLDDLPPVPAPVKTPVPQPQLPPVQQPRDSVHATQAPAAPASSSSVRMNAGLGFGGPHQDLELRAVFATNESFTPYRALQLTAQLPGIEGCLLFSRDGRVHGEEMPRTDRSRKLATQMPEIFEKVIGLARNLGFDETETFTLHTGNGVLSFFGDGQTCLGVLHDESELVPGVREKLVLISRGVARLV